MDIKMMGVGVALALALASAIMFTVIVMDPRCDSPIHGCSHDK